MRTILILTPDSEADHGLPGSKSHSLGVKRPYNRAALSHDHSLAATPCSVSVPSVVPLLFLFLTQTEIVAEHGLERFSFPLFKLTDARRRDRSENCPNFFHFRVLPPDGEREHFDHRLP